MAVKDYETAASNNDGSGNLFPEGVLAAQLNNNLRQMQADLRSFANDADFFAYGDGSGEVTINVISGTVFRIVGSDQRSAYHEKRRVRAVGASTGTRFGTITGVSFTSGNTDVTVDWDSGSLSVETVEISIGNLSANQNSSFPRKLIGDFEILGAFKADNLQRPVQKLTDVDFSNRTVYTPTSSQEIFSFSVVKERAETELVVDGVVSFFDRADQNKVALLTVRIGSDRRSYTIPTTEKGEDTFASAVCKARFSGLSSGTKTVRVDLERIGAPMNFVVNPNDDDTPSLSGRQARSSFTIAEF